MYKQEASEPFQEPVDPVKLGIPDYPIVITNPMDLSTIKTKLATGQYSVPWQYIDDVSLMFHNAWRFNRPKSPVFVCCDKVKK